MTDEGPTARPGTGLRPVRVPRAVDEVADRLLTAIALGEFSVGERLPPERDLAEILGVSRATVRAAVSRLHATGCLEAVRGRKGGHYVLPGWERAAAGAVRRVLVPRWERAQELLDTRRLIESLIARTAAERRTPEDVAAIMRALEEYERAPDAERTRNADGALHQAIARAAKNEQLARYSRRLLQDISAGFPIEPYRGNLTAQALADHRALAAAVADGAPDAAAEIALRHFEITERNIQEVVQSTVDAPPAES